MKKQAQILALTVILSSCFSRSAVMTRNNFDEISVGSSVLEVEKKAGKPFAVYKQEGGDVEYEYIERIFLGEELLEERHYFLIIKEGKVVSKRLGGTQHPPAYDEIYEADPNDTDLQ